MAEQFKSVINLKGKENPKGITLLATALEGGINEIPVAYVEFVSRDKKLDLGSLVGTEIGVSFEGETNAKQRFWGTCISAETKGVVNIGGRYVAELRPWLWFLTRSQNNRIYQNKKTTEIIQDILGDYGFSSDLEIKHSKSDVERVYCTQYRETDFDFIKRLLEEEGFYFYFDHKDGAVKLILADQVSTHDAPTADDSVPFRDVRGVGRVEHIAQWDKIESAVTGKVTLRDYDPINPSADLTASSAIASGEHKHVEYENYRYPGRYTKVPKGEEIAAALVEAEAAGHQIWRAGGNILHLTAGRIFKLIDHPRHTTADDSTFMVTKITQFIRTEVDQSKYGGSVLQSIHAGALAAEEHMSVMFNAVLKSKPFRMLPLTPRPEISGVQTALVTGGSGDEIAIDEYGRIKVHFHWDRKKEKDDKSSCWVRTMMPWTGKDWGMVSWPRVGQEVVIQFEEGDPDRPLCVGMLYNAETMPPYDLPGNATRSGIKTNSSKGGGGYNELMFEDKKGDELIRFEAEKDYTQLVQNSAHVRVGYKHEDDTKQADAQGDRSMKLEVENHLDELVEKGDHSFEVKAGEQKIKIKKDKTEKVSGNSKLTVTGNVKEKIETGNLSREVTLGNQDVTLKTGNYSIDTTLGKVDITALQSISLKVGGNSIVIDQVGVTIKGIVVKIEGTAMLDAKAPLSMVKGDSLLVLKGGFTFIN